MRNVQEIMDTVGVNTLIYRVLSVSTPFKKNKEQYSVKIDKWSSCNASIDCDWEC